jgi:hypothetical protein
LYWINGGKPLENLIENVTIIYKNGLKRFCDVISITDKGIYSGYMKNSNKKEFINSNFIPLNQIKKILAFTENGKCKNIDFRKKINSGGK